MDKYSVELKLKSTESYPKRLVFANFKSDFMELGKTKYQSEVEFLGKLSIHALQSY